MKASIRLGSIAGVEVGLHYSWFLVIALLSWSLSASFLPDRYSGWGTSTYWITGISAALLLFVSVLIHEMAHSLVARARGFPVSGITLFVLGGVSNLKADARKASDEFVIATVGPLTSFALAGLLWLVWLVVGDGRSPIDAMLFYLAFINALLGAFNMLPAFPLDGGRVLRSAIWAFTGSHTKATRFASLAGQLVGIGMMVLGVVQFLWGGNLISGIWLALLGWFLQNAAGRTQAETDIQAGVFGVKVKDVMASDVPTIDPGASIHDAVFGSLLRRGARALPVCDGGMVVGLLSLTDVKRLPRDQWPHRIVRSEMTAAPLVTVGPDQDLAHAMDLLAGSGIHQLPVIEDGKLVGLISRSHVMQYLYSVRELGISRG